MDEDLREAAALLAMGLLPTELLPELAVDALLRGVDSPSLCILAGLGPRDVRDARDAFECAMAELGIDPLSAGEARWFLTYRKLRGVVAGQVSPALAARWIWAHMIDEGEFEGDLRIFIGLASVIDDYPEGRAEIEVQIVEAAREFLERPAPRRWLKLHAVPGHGSLWTRSPGGPNGLPIGEDLREAVEVWTAEYQATIGADESSGFLTKADAIAFVEQGRQLVQRLQRELGPGWHVEYMPEPVEPPGLRLRARPAGGDLRSRCNADGSGRIPPRTQITR